MKRHRLDGKNPEVLPLLNLLCLGVVIKIGVYKLVASERCLQGSVWRVIVIVTQLPWRVYNANAEQLMNLSRLFKIDDDNKSIIQSIRLIVSPSLLKRRPSSGIVISLPFLRRFNRA